MAVRILLLLGLWLAGCDAVGPEAGLGQALPPHIAGGPAQTSAPSAAPPPPAPVIAPPPYCTRSIGSVDCWRQPPLALPLPRGVADGRTVPVPPTVAPWPWR
jgi:hypothetical protein